MYSEVTYKGTIRGSKIYPTSINYKIRYFLNSLRGKFNPSFLMFGITYNCQANCIHCCIKDYIKENEKELTTEETKNVLTQAKNLNLMFVDWFGGEPILREDIIELVKYSHNLGFYNFLETNGFGISKDKLIELKKAGLDTLFLSLESTDAKTNDKFKGLKNCYKNAIQCLKNSVEIGLGCIISTCTTRENIISGEIKKIIQLAKELKVDGVRLILPISSGKWLHSEEVMLTVKEEKKLEKLIDYPFVFWESIYKYNIKDCASKGKYFYISPFGDVQPCPVVPFSFGNIREESLKNILERMWSHQMFKEGFGKTCMMLDHEFRKKYINKIPSNVKLPIRI